MYICMYAHTIVGYFEGQSNGPSIAELVDKENVDMLQYMSWEIDQSKDLVKVTIHIVFSMMS